MYRRVARIWKRGAILKEWEKCKRPWPEFSLFLNQFHTVCPKIQTKFLGKLGNSKVFSAQNRVVSKKRKKKTGLRRNWDWFFGRNPKFKGFFPPKLRWSPKKKKKKKGLRRNWDRFFGQIRKFKRLRGAVFLWEGYFQFFTKNRPQKHQKRTILRTSQANGEGSSPPPPPPWLRYWQCTINSPKWKITWVLLSIILIPIIAMIWEHCEESILDLFNFTLVKILVSIISIFERNPNNRLASFHQERL